MSAARTGEWTPELRAHADACPHCRELVELSLSLQALVPVSEAGPLPDPRILVRKARLLETLQEKDAAVARAVRPLDVAATVSLAVAGALIAWSAVPLLAVVALLGGLRVVWAVE